MVAITVLGVIGVLYFIEVRMGASRSMFSCELGVSSQLEQKERLTRIEFFGKVAPLILAVVGLPLMAYSFFEAIVLLAGSAALLIWSHRARGSIPAHNGG
jgi:hypothetical protein